MGKKTFDANYANFRELVLGRLFTSVSVRTPDYYENRPRVSSLSSPSEESGIEGEEILVA